MNLTPFSKYWLLAALFIIVGLSIVDFAIESKAKIYEIPFFLFFGWVFIGSYFLRQVKCSSCNTPVTYMGKVMGFSTYSGFVGRNCKNCGASLCSPK